MNKRLGLVVCSALISRALHFRDAFVRAEKNDQGL